MPDYKERQINERGKANEDWVQFAEDDQYEPEVVWESRHAQFKHTLEAVKHGIQVYEKRLKQPSGATTHKIRWMGKQNQLVWLFEELEKVGLLHKETIDNWAVTVRDCFVDENGKPFKDRQMRTVKSDPTQQVKGEKAEVITDIVKRIPKKSS